MNLHPIRSRVIIIIMTSLLLLSALLLTVEYYQQKSGTFITNAKLHRAYHVLQVYRSQILFGVMLGLGLLLVAYSYLEIRELQTLLQVALNTSGSECDHARIAEEIRVRDRWLKECTVLHQTTQGLHQACLEELDTCNTGFEYCIQLIDDRLAHQFQTAETGATQQQQQQIEQDAGWQREKAALIIAYTQCLQQLDFPGKSKEEGDTPRL